ncbi:MAG: heavy metal-associated domain-containing protein [Actinomycetes bacterium]
MSTIDLRVSGMTCEHCVSAVTKEFTAVPGVTAVSVDLVADGVSTVHVTSDSALADSAIAAALEEAGYELAAN